MSSPNMLETSLNTTRHSSVMDPLLDYHTSGGSYSVSTYVYLTFFVMQSLLSYSNARLKRIVATHCNWTASQKWI